VTKKVVGVFVDFSCATSPTYEEKEALLPKYIMTLDKILSISGGKPTNYYTN
jgi:hypothetical protein